MDTGSKGLVPGSAVTSPVKWNHRLNALGVESLSAFICGFQVQIKIAIMHVYVRLREGLAGAAGLGKGTRRFPLRVLCLCVEHSAPKISRTRLSALRPLLHK